MFIYVIYIIFREKGNHTIKNSSHILREEQWGFIIFLLCKNEQEMLRINNYHVSDHYVIFHRYLPPQSQGNRYHEIFFYHNYIGIPNKIHYENL